MSNDNYMNAIKTMCMLIINESNKNRITKNCVNAIIRFAQHIFMEFLTLSSVVLGPGFKIK